MVERKKCYMFAKIFLNKLQYYLDMHLKRDVLIKQTFYYG